MPQTGQSKSDREEVRYEELGDLPETLRTTLPREAQEVYLEAYKKAWDEYTEEEGGQAGREAVANRNAMAAVEKGFVHDSESGKWRRRGEETKEAKRKGIIESIREMF
jgi:cation transport regulator